MICSFLVLSIISFHFIASSRCCTFYQCTLIDNETLCTNLTSRCHWSGGVCVGNTCADFDYEKSCYGSHNTGSYTDEFYCKWNGTNCVAGIADCSNYDNSATYCHQSGKCRHDGTNCVAASSCSDFSGPDISQCDDQALSGFGTRCHVKDSVCKIFACSDVDDAPNCGLEDSCYWVNSACAPVTSCSLITEGNKCMDSSDITGGRCSWINGKCKEFYCGDFDEPNCLRDDGCVWNSGICQAGRDMDICGAYTNATLCSHESTYCYYIKKCPINTSFSPSMIIYVPGLFVVFLLSFLL